MKIDYTDLNTWGIFATFIGLIISIITLIVANNVKRATQKLQNSLSFDKRVPAHLKQIDILLKDFNSLLNNIKENTNQIKALLALIRSEINSLSIKITDKKSNKLITVSIKQLNKNIKREFISKQNTSENNFYEFVQLFYRVTEDDYWQTYTDLGELYRTVDNLVKDKKVIIKP